MLKKQPHFNELLIQEDHEQLKKEKLNAIASKETADKKRLQEQDLVENQAIKQAAKAFIAEQNKTQIHQLKKQFNASIASK